MKDRSHDTKFCHIFSLTSFKTLVVRISQEFFYVLEAQDETTTTATFLL